MNDHGGNIHEKAKKNGVAPHAILDFSASINPLGMPRTALAALREQIALLPHYPEPYSESLTRALAEHYGVSPRSILCGNGSTELIYLIPRALNPKQVLVTAPAFSEYEKACAASKPVRIRRYRLNPKDGFCIDPRGFIDAMRGCDLAFLGNPNNPTGRMLKKDAILTIAAAARRQQCRLVVDEAFIDFCPEESVIAAVARNPYLIILRSMTKFYAFAGLRLGFGVFPSALYGKIKARKEPWSVNSLAAGAGSVVLSDTAFRNASLSLIAREKKFVEKSLNLLGIPFVPSQANYYLLSLKDARSVIRRLEKKGILVRDCSNFKGLGPGYVRIAVRSRKENARLLKELGRVSRALASTGSLSRSGKRFLTTVKNEASRVSSSALHSRCSSRKPPGASGRSRDF